MPAKPRKRPPAKPPRVRGRKRGGAGAAPRPPRSGRAQPLPRLDKSSTLGTVVRRLIEQMGATDRIREQRAVQIWAETVGERIAGVARAESISQGKLMIKVSDPAWRNELHYLKDEIRKQLNERLGETVVSDIVFR